MDLGRCDLTETFIETEDEHVEELLDLLSPNWRDADSCGDGGTHRVTVQDDLSVGDSTVNGWENAVKIHEVFGGTCCWQEAIDTPGVMWEGKCLHCHADHLVIKDMIPIGRRVMDAFDLERPGLLKTVKNTPIEDRKGLEWVDNDAWDQNRDRLRKELGR